MRILLFGRGGQLGCELHRCLVPLAEVIAVDKEDLDLTQLDRIPSLIREIHPQIIINAAAYTAVDNAESEQDLARTLNADAPRVMAEEAKRIRALFIHYSTDYVFDGEKGAPYQEKDLPNPINYYGKSKLDGEEAIKACEGSHLILRTSWVYNMRFPSFPTKVLKWARDQKVIRIVEDQVGSPTWARMLAQVTALLLMKGTVASEGWLEDRSGIYHLACDGAVSRYEWANEILKLDPKGDEQVVEKVLAVDSEVFPTPAKRPKFPALNCDWFEKVFDFRMPDWRLALRLAMDELASE